MIDHPQTGQYTSEDISFFDIVKNIGVDKCE